MSERKEKVSGTVFRAGTVRRGSLFARLAPIACLSAHARFSHFLEHTPMNESDIKKAARTEQLWYAATATGLNGFLMSQRGTMPGFY